MNVRMMLELLIPGVQDAEESDLRAEVLRVTPPSGSGLSNCTLDGLE